jgi:hypothetical protein
MPSEWWSASTVDRDRSLISRSATTGHRQFALKEFSPKAHAVICDLLVSARCHSTSKLLPFDHNPVS